MELAEGLAPEEAAAVRDALRRYLEGLRPRLSPWVVAGRAENTRQGALQFRYQDDRAWQRVGHDFIFARQVSEARMGRGDSK